MWEMEESLKEKRLLLIKGKDKLKDELAEFLSRFGFEVKRIATFSEASPLLEFKGATPIILLDLIPFNSHFIKLFENWKTKNPELSIIALSNSKNPELAISLLEQGLIDQVASPDNFAGVFSAVRNELSKKSLFRENVSFLQKLKKLKVEHERNMRKALELEEIYNSTLENLMTALDLRDVETFGHSRTVAKYSQVLAKILGIKDSSILDNIKKGALLHDVGKIAIPDSILKKPASLTEEEWEKIKLHPTLGFGLIKEIKLVKEAGNIILCHHERYDGKGYPTGLKGEEIPLEARIFALADALDAITSHRPYRKERDFQTAKKIINENSGSQFDPKAVEAFCSLSLEKWEKIRYETTRLISPFELFIK